MEASDREERLDEPSEMQKPPPDLCLAARLPKCMSCIQELHGNVGPAFRLPVFCDATCSYALSLRKNSHAMRPLSVSAAPEVPQLLLEKPG